MILLVMGAPGAGKGTQADFIVEKKGFIKISTGDVFRKHIREKTPLGQKVSELIASGGLVDDQTTFELVKVELEGAPKEQTVILDGYPRNPKQAEMLAEYMKVEKTQLLGVLFLDVSQEVVEARISNRRLCRGCGATYHLEYKKPAKEDVCDACGGEIYQRRDDQPENVIHRLKVYREETAPVLDFYKDSRRLVEIDGGKSLEEVQNLIADCIEKLEKSIA